MTVTTIKPVASVSSTSIVNLNNVASSSPEEEAVSTVCQYGLPLKALLSNFSCIFGLQSGVAAINPKTKVRGVLQKRLPVSINWDRLPGEIKEAFRQGGDDNKGKDNLMDWVESTIEKYSEEDRVFKYGDEILSMSAERSSEELFTAATIFGAVDVPKPFHVCFLKHTKMNQPLIPRGVVGLKKTTDKEEEDKPQWESDLKADVIKFNILFDLDVTSQWWKLRGDGIKATTCPIELKFFGDFNSTEELQVEWDVMFGIESLKGGLAYLASFTNAHGGGVIDVEEGNLTLHSGEVVSLDDTNGPLQKWIQTNTHEVWVEFKMINAEFRSVLVKRDASSIALEASEVTEKTDLYLVSIHQDYVLLREKIQVLMG